MKKRSTGHSIFTYISLLILACESPPPAQDMSDLGQRLYDGYQADQSLIDVGRATDLSLETDLETEPADLDVSSEVRDQAPPHDSSTHMEPLSDVGVNPDISEPIRVACFTGEPTETGLSAPPATCRELFNRAPQLRSGCYLLAQPDGLLTESYCWRQRGLVFLVNNEIETDTHPDDIDQDGVIDQGELEGQNFPADPLNLNALEIASRLQTEVRDYFEEISYGALIFDLEVYWAGEGSTEREVQPEEGELEREQWYRLRALRPTFANDLLIQDLCQRRGGMTIEDWRAYDFIATVISDGTSTSGSQWRQESLPVGAECDQVAEVIGDYIVMKRFRSWNRLGTLFHEIAHTLSRDPLPEPSIGHSEAIHAETGERAEYGDRTDLMGRSSARGHLSGPQKAFLRYLPDELIEEMNLDHEFNQVTLSPLEPPLAQLQERRLLQIQASEGLHYHVEVRRAIGSDARLDPIFFEGALIKRAKDLNQANKSFIVDPTPETPSVNSTDSVLLPQRTFSDSANQIHISALSSDESGVTVVVRRAPTSANPPVLNDTLVTVERNESDQVVRVTLTAIASPGEPLISSDELLYFWKLGPRDTPYTEAPFKTGQTISISRDERPSELWLVVSDQRGGETWRAVNALAEIAPRCGDGVVNGDEECDDGNEVTETCEFGEASCTVCADDCTLIEGALCPAPEPPPSPLGPGCEDTCDCVELNFFTPNRANNGVCEVYVYPAYEDFCCERGTDCSDCQGVSQPPVTPPCQAGSSGIGGEGLASTSLCADACCPGVLWRYPLEPEGLRPDQRPEICDDCLWSVEEDQCGRITNYWIYDEFDYVLGFSNCEYREINADAHRCQHQFEFDEFGNTLREDKTCYFRIEPDLIEHWLHSYDAQGRRAQSEHWLEDEYRTIRTLVQYSYDEEGRVTTEIHHEIPPDDMAYHQLGVIPDELNPTFAKRFTYGACEITVSTDEGIDGEVDSVETIPYPEWWR